MAFAASIRRAAADAIRGLVGVSIAPPRLDDLISEGRSFPQDSTDV